MAKIETVDDGSFEATVLRSEVPYVLEFGAAWCPPCKVLLAALERFADETAGTVRVGALDVDDSPDVTTRYAVRGAPTVLVFVGGREVLRHVGATTKENIAALVARARAA
ncbi:MAG: thioredoxin domain-containing protein [Polyangiaceae bacterium]